MKSILESPLETRPPFIRRSDKNSHKELNWTSKSRNSHLRHRTSKWVLAEFREMLFEEHPFSGTSKNESLLLKQMEEIHAATFLIRSELKMKYISFFSKKTNIASMKNIATFRKQNQETFCLVFCWTWVKLSLYIWTWKVFKIKSEWNRLVTLFEWSIPATYDLHEFSLVQYETRCKK